MAFREVSVTEIREVLRLWVRGEGLRSIERLVWCDRKTIRRYVQAAEAAGLVREDGEEQRSDELIGAVVEAVRLARPAGRGVAWQRCEAERERIKGWLAKGVPVVKIAELLARRGVVVPERTLHRFCAEELGYRRQPSTVPVVDGEPGGEVQLDFGRLGYLPDHLSPVVATADACPACAALYDASRGALGRVRWRPGKGRDVGTFRSAHATAITGGGRTVRSRA